MITFNIRAHNGNFLRSHIPDNNHGNCWCSKQENALVFTIEQAREIVSAWRGYLSIVIALLDTPISNEDFQLELFCCKGGRWCDYKPSEDI